MIGRTPAAGGKRGQAPFVRSTLRAVPANGACPLFPGQLLPQSVKGTERWECSKEFKDFAVKGNAIDMAVGIVIGGAFGSVVSSLVNDVVMPPIGLLTRGIDFSKLAVQLNKETVIKYGAFINSIITFVIVAFAIFLVIRQINRLKKAPPPAEPMTKECPRCCSRHLEEGQPLPPLHVGVDGIDRRDGGRLCFSITRFPAILCAMLKHNRELAGNPKARNRIPAHAVCGGALGTPAGAGYIVCRHVFAYGVCGLQIAQSSFRTRRVRFTFAQPGYRTCCVRFTAAQFRFPRTACAVLHWRPSTVRVLLMQDLQPTRQRSLFGPTFAFAIANRARRLNSRPATQFRVRVRALPPPSR